MIDLDKITELVIDKLKTRYFLVPINTEISNVDKNNLLNIVLNFVSIETGVSPELIKSSSRINHVVASRRLFFYISNKVSEGKISLQTIGSMVNKDHATVIYSLKTIKDYMSFDSDYNRYVNAMTDSFISLNKTKP